MPILTSRNARAGLVRTAIASPTHADLQPRDLNGFHPGVKCVSLIGPGRELPKGMDEEACCEHLIHRGALHVAVDDAVSCPIPSFRRHLIRKAKLEPLQIARNPGPETGRK